MKYLIDLDDTLVDSTTLNNDAYNFALEMYGFNRILTNNRITRSTIPNYKNKNDIINLKQQYFISDWLPYRIQINNELLDKIKQWGSKNCYVWTKANSCRVNKILEDCNLKQYFCNIIFDDKKSFDESMDKLNKIFYNNEHLIIYENNHKFFKNKKCIILDSIKNQFSNIKGYLVR